MRAATARTLTPLLALASGCLINSELYRERRDALASDDHDRVDVADADADADADSDADGDADTDPPADIDGDGFVDGEDCDDDDPTVHPGACEVCGDGTDQDCAGGDVACHPPLDPSFDLVASGFAFEGEVAGGWAGIGVGSAGDFDGNGLDDLLVGASLADAGGHARAGSAYLLLSPLGATVSLGSAAARFDGADDEDRVGVAVAAADLDLDGLSDLAIGAKLRDGSPGDDAGAVYVVSGTPLPPSALNIAADVGVELLGDPRSEAGGALAHLVDVDGVPGDDLAVGATAYAEGRGCVYVVSAGAGPIVAGTNFRLSAMGRALDGAPGDGLGDAVAGPGDIDGDGLGDLVVGASSAAGLAPGAGAVYVVPGSAELSPGPRLPIGPLAHTLQGVDAADHAGTSVAGGDIDGDGHVDVVVGARSVNGPTHDQGAAYVVSGARLVGPLATLDLATADARILGEAPGDRLGQAVAVPGDLDCDGHDDLLLGADGYDGQRGAAYVVFGPVSGDLSLVSAPDIVRMYGTPGSDDVLGAYLAGAGDLDGDTHPDLVIGAYKASGTANAAGRAWVVFGSGP